MLTATEAKNEIGSVEASKRLGIRTDYLLMLARCGKIQARKEEGTWRFSVEALEQRKRERDRV